MKDYIKSKIKKAYHLTLQGANRVDDEDSEALSRNITSLQQEFRITTPTLSSKLFLSTARLETLDLISEGPIEGFFNNNGEACNILEATFIDETPIVESSKSRKSVSKFKVDNLKGCFVDYSTGTMDILNDYQGFLDNKFPMKQRVLDPHSLKTVRAPEGLLTGDHLASDGNIAVRTRNIVFKFGINWLLGGAKTEDRKAAIFYVDNNLARTFRVNGQTIDNSDLTNTLLHKESVKHLGKGLALGRRRESGAGYTLSPYVNVRYYGQDEIAPLKEGPRNQKGSGNFLIPNTNIVDLSRPKRYQGSVKHGCGLTTGGNIDTAFVSRSFLYQLTDFYDYSGKSKTVNGKSFVSPISAFLSTYCAPIMFSGQFWGDKSLAVGTSNKVPRRHDGTPVSGHRPIDIFHDFEDSALYPRGLKEPIIQAVQNKIKELPYKGHMLWDKYGVFSSPMGLNTHKHTRQNQSCAKTIFHEEVYDSEGTASRQNVMEIKALRTSSSSFSVRTPLNGARGTLETSNYLSGFSRDHYDLQHFDTLDKDATYTISYDYYIPSDNQSCRGFKAIIHSKDYNHTWTLTPSNSYKFAPSTFQTGVWTHYESESANIDNAGIRLTGIGCRTGRFTIHHRGPAESGRRDDRSLGFIFLDANGNQNSDYANSSLDGDSIFITNLRLKKNNQENTSVGSKTGYFIFDSNANTFHDEHIAPDYELNFGLSSDTESFLFNTQSSESLNYVFPEVTGFSGRVRNIVEPITRELDFNVRDTGIITYRPLTVTGSSRGFDHNIEITEQPHKKFRGPCLWPVFLGETMSGMKGVSDGSFEKVLITSSDSTTVANNKLNSGIEHKYDVFSGDSNGEIVYVNLANPAIQIPPSDVTGKNISLILQERQPATFNYANVSVYNNLGYEIQEPLTSGSLAEHTVAKQLFGPFELTDNDATGINTGDPYGQNTEPFETYFKKSAMSQPNYDNTGSIDGLNYSGVVHLHSDSSNDYFVGGSGFIQNNNPYHVRDLPATRKLINYTDYIRPRHKDRDAIPYVHTFNRKEVDRFKATLRIGALQAFHPQAKNPFSDGAEKDITTITFQLEIGFQFLSDAVYKPKIIKLTYEGLVMSAYTTDTIKYKLPKYEDIIEFFPDETIDSLADKYKRYVKFNKLDFESRSSRIKKEGGIYSITEYVTENFSYPNSCLVRLGLDARSFQAIPNRQYNVRLKKILIPSNYFPLDRNGRDKRFIRNSSISTDRKVYHGDWDGSFKMGWTDNPAWILYDLMINPRYGLGSRMDDIEDINIFNLYEIGRYCDAVDVNGNFVGVNDNRGGLEPRFSCNIVFREPTPAFQALEQIANIFNGRAFYSNGALDFYSDRPVEPSMHFSNSSVANGDFVYSETHKASEFNCVRVYFEDKFENFTRKVEVAEDEEGIRKNGKLIRTIEGKGITSRGQARRLARYILYTTKLEKEIVGFQAGLESLALNVGDVITISDELKNFELTEAKVLERSGNTVTIENVMNTGVILDNGFFYTPSGAGTLTDAYRDVRLGQSVTKNFTDNLEDRVSTAFPITKSTRVHNGIKLELDTSSATEEYDLIPTGSFMQLETINDQASKRYRVIEIKPSPDQSNLYSIKGTEYNSGKFNLIENEDEDFNISQEVPFNIGIPEHEIKKADDPVSFSVTESENEFGLNDIFYDIKFQPESNINRFLITVISPNGLREFDEKEATQDISNGDGTVSTTGAIRNLSVFGTYNIFVNSEL
jgi:hypothetical protein